MSRCITLLNSPTEGHVGHFQFGIIINKDATNICVQAFFCHTFFTHLGSCKEVWLQRSTIKQVLENHENGFQSGYTTLHSLHQWKRVPIVLHTHENLGLLVFWILAILIEVYWNFIFLLIYIFLVTYDVEHLFICLFAICISSLVSCQFRSFIHYLIGLFVFLLLGLKSSLYILDNILYQICLLQIFSCKMLFVFILLTDTFTEQQYLILMKSIQLINSFFSSMNCAFSVISKKSSPNPRSSIFSPVLSFRSFIILHFIFRPVIHLTFCERWKFCA